MNLQSHYDLKMACRDLPPKAAVQGGERLMPWSHRPRYEDDLPEYPNWAEWHEDERRYWATCIESSKPGISIARAYGAAHRFLVEIVLLDSEFQWAPDQVVYAKDTETFDE